MIRYQADNEYIEYMSILKTSCLWKQICFARIPRSFREGCKIFTSKLKKRSGYGRLVRGSARVSWKRGVFRTFWTFHVVQPSVCLLHTEIDPLLESEKWYIDSHNAIVCGCRWPSRRRERCCRALTAQEPEPVTSHSSSATSSVVTLDSWQCQKCLQKLGKKTVAKKENICNH